MPIEVKFCTAKWTHVPVGPAKFDLNRCNESPLRGEKPDFWPVSKFNTGSLRLRGILPVISYQNRSRVIFRVTKFLSSRARGRPCRNFHLFDHYDKFAYCVSYRIGVDRVPKNLRQLGPDP